MSLPQNHYLVIFIVASHYNDIKEYILTYTNEYIKQIDVIASQLQLHMQHPKISLIINRCLIVFVMLFDYMIDLNELRYDVN